MADSPTPNTSGDKEAGFLKAMARIGVKIDPATSEDVKKALTPLQKYMADFSKTTDIKNTFFGKLPGIKQMMKDMKPDTLTFTENMSVLGAASKAGADNNQDFYNSLGVMGKLLANTQGKLLLMGGTTSMLTRLMTGLASFGISLVVEGLLLVAQGLKNIITAAIVWQDELNTFSKMMGGIAKDRILVFNEAVNKNLMALSGYGFALGDFVETFKSYIKSGLNPAIATSVELTKTTLQLAAVTGQSVSELATFWSSIYRGSHLSLSSFKDMGDMFTSFNASAEKTGVIGTISFSQFKEAITTTGTALLIAASHGTQFTKKLSADLVGLAGLANALNISVSDLNDKFEESANLIRSADSPFRALLAISGGANIGNMLGNQFDRTEAMLKVSDKLSQLTAQFGGNLNIMGQVAEQSFGISKDIAIKFAQMTGLQKQALMQAKKDAELMKSGGLEESWKNVSTTLSSVFDRFKNTIFTMFQRAFVGGGAVQGLLNKIGSTLGRYLTEMTDPGSGISRTITVLGNIISKVFSGADSLLNKLEPFLNGIVDWINSTFTRFTNDFNKSSGFWAGVKTVLKDIFFDPFLQVMTVGGKILVESLLYAWNSMSFGPSRGQTEEEQYGKVGGFSEKLAKIMREGFKLNDTVTVENTIATKELTAINKRIQKAQDEENRYSSFKDTDIVINKMGEYSLAGIERNKLEEEKLKLEKEREQREIEDSKNLEKIAANTNPKNPQQEVDREAARANSMAGIVPLAAGTPIDDATLKATNTARMQANYGF